MTTDKDKQTPAISIVMPAYNAEMYIREAIDSVNCQSFPDFECIVVDDGSTDGTRDIIRAYDDKRMVLLENKHDFTASLNLGMDAARGRYIACMDADDIMHPDRLKIQFALMEAEPGITVCGTWMQHTGKGALPRGISGNISGLVEYPLLQFLKGNFMCHPTAMIRKDFLKENQLSYENYAYAEDYKLWTEIAKKGGTFYVESQPLLYCRISENQITNRKGEEQVKTSEKIVREVLLYLIEKNKKDLPELMSMFEAVEKLREKGMIPVRGVSDLFQKVFYSNKNRLLLV
ncbi:glycosyltransferase family 2 protein [Proteiniphilum sp. X52]|uniref:glycosyltransferase family 2 protein n=1 Tax=Proteiniphilum sp. X52 TaxID=2382159 RepID=UPI000F09BB82|nr:glycosyltransferase family 2 protein [Proteiniphilum sp. X52]RNC64977.1 glycosyltransferase family 2 protein [Proteiniphilum sp. X52]